MRKRIFSSIFFVAIICVAFSSILVYIINYYSFKIEIEKSIISTATYLSEFLNQDENSNLDTFSKIDSSRITLIKSDGNVIYDSDRNPSQMENHSNRIEFINAIKNGIGKCSRISNTLDTESFYYAVKLQNGNVLRIANTQDSIYKTASKEMPLFLLILAFTIILSYFIAKHRTKNIVEPINNYNLENLSESDVYEELAPFAKKIEKQKVDIKDKIDLLKSERTQFSAITENMDEGFLIVNSNLCVLSGNISVVNILECEKSIDGKSLLVLTRNMVILNSIKKSILGIQNENTIDIKSKSYYIISKPVYVENCISGAVMIFLDITEKKEREELRREFSANVSHELKTPLTSISGYAEIMKNGLVKFEDIPHFSELIYNEADRLIHLISDIIKLSNLDEKENSFQKTKVDLYELSKKVKNLLTEYAQKKNVAINVFGESTIIDGNSDLLCEMIFNICDNAIKYNKENGKVEISTYKVSGKATISIKDTGIGIPTDLRERIFERFYRVDKSHSKQTGGTGLGLSIVKHIANLNNAQIAVESTKDGGTEFIVTF